MKKNHWLVCDVTDHKQTQCLFDEHTALKMGDPPRCIRHGALLFSDTALDGMARDAARKHIDRHKDPEKW